MIAAITLDAGARARTQARAIAFLDHFFADISSDAAVSEKLLKRCYG